MLNETNQTALNNIMDCFTGADGGVRFIMLRSMLERMQDEDSQTGEMILDYMRKFSRLIDVANKK